MPRAATKPRVRSRSPNEKTRGEAKVRAHMDTSTKAKAALVSVDKPLTDQQRLFVKYWAEGNPLAAASRMAGYADGAAYAYRMAHQPNILALYNEEKRKYEEASQMTRKRVIDGLLEAVDMAKLLGEPSTMVQGWKTIGQMCGYFAPVEVKHTVTHEGKVLQERLNQLTDEELMELIVKRASEAPALPPPAANEDVEDVPA